MKLTPYLSFDGQCEAAFKFYEKCLDGKIAFMMSYGDSPMAADMPPAALKRIMHATLTVGDQILHGADAPDRYQKPQGISITIGLTSAADAERIFAALAEGGEVQMPIQETFWADRFGMLTDRFGTPWMINCEKPA